MFLPFKKIWETFCTDFVNYFVEILGIKLFHNDFGKTVIKLLVKYEGHPKSKLSKIRTCSQVNETARNFRDI